MHFVFAWVRSAKTSLGGYVNRSLGCSAVVVLLAVLSPNRARADEITVAGTTAVTGLPSTILFPGGSFSGTTSDGYAGFSNLGVFSLLTTPAVYNGQSVDLQITFELPLGTNNSPSTFVADLFGNVNTNAQGGVTIAFTDPSENFAFSNASGSGTFTFTINSVSLNPGGSAFLTGYVTNGYVTAPEPTSALLWGLGLLAMGCLFAIKKVQ